MSAEQAQNTEAAPAVQGEDARKVFVGNLAFATTGEDLKQLFAGKGNILEAQIISRGRRSLGYGFVTFESEQDAAQAISSMDKTEIEGRAINCEIAKPPSSSRRGNVSSNGAEGDENAAPQEGGGRGRRPRGRGRGGRRGGRRPAADGEAEDGTGELVDQMGVLEVNGADNVPEANPLPGVDMEPAGGERRGRGRGRGGRRGGRGAGPRRAAPTGEPSKTMIFVANLPFSIDNDGLKAIFEGLNVATATVITRKRGPVEGKSKGFGFVEFASEEDQQKAVETYNGREVEGRALQVKIALDQLVDPNEPDSAVLAE